ncbi:unnamed protein product, partial [Amoebophrya sp. A120]
RAGGKGVGGLLLLAAARAFPVRPAGPQCGSLRPPIGSERGHPALASAPRCLRPPCRCVCPEARPMRRSGAPPAPFSYVQPAIVRQGLWASPASIASAAWLPPCAAAPAHAVALSSLPDLADEGLLFHGATEMQINPIHVLLLAMPPLA